MLGRSVIICVSATLAGASCTVAMAAQDAARDKAPAVTVASPDPSAWPALSDPAAGDRAIERRARDILAKMSLERKVGQVIQADIASITPEEVGRFGIGAVLNGGNSKPGGGATAAGPAWLAAADAYWAASMSPADGPVIPVMWGSDAVHGHSSVTGATLFPHNIGLGAARDPDLVRRIAAATAVEMRVTGLDWTFAPTLAVARDDRWGRTYESFSESPDVVRSYAGPIVEGYQGRVGSADWLRGPHVIATAKHFVGDGGTTGGRDQGDDEATEAMLRDQQAAGYGPALTSGVRSVMASYSSWRGAKMHGSRAMLTDVLKARMGFGGFVVGDWNGHGQVPGCTPTECPEAMRAGLDMYMAPDSWRELRANLLAEARDGRLPIARLDDAVLRILRVKLSAGLFEAGRPSSRPLAGRFELLGSAEHRALAREAVRKSLVLLKNERAALPLRQGQRTLIAGDAADDAARQSGGWTLTWQGTGTTRADFPGATTLREGLEAEARRSGATTTYDPDGRYGAKPDVAVVVFGETPYAEFQGDLPDVGFRDPGRNLEILRRLKAQGVRTVAVFLSGRPLWTNPYINAADAFVAAWLPGSEGGGVADVLFGRGDFTGRLSFSWPRTAAQTPLNVGDPDYRPLFAFGYGLSYARPGSVPALDERPGAATGSAGADALFARGRLRPGLAFLLREEDGAAAPGGAPAPSRRGWISAAAADHRAQEDARTLTWSGAGAATWGLKARDALDLRREANAGLALEIGVRVEAAPTATTTLSIACGPGCGQPLDVTGALRGAASPGWVRITIPLRCLAPPGARLDAVTEPLLLTTAGRLRITVDRVALVPGASGPCPTAAKVQRDG